MYFLNYYSIDKYDGSDWIAYAKETGNNPLNKMSFSKNGIEKVIDDATGFSDMQECDMLKFSIWAAEGFLDGFLDGFLKGDDD